MDVVSQQTTVRGRVQGVGFRAYTRHCAQKLGLTGHVRNLPDGSVHILACAAPDTLREFWALIQLGPPLSRVEPLAITDMDFIPESKRFDIVF